MKMVVQSIRSMRTERKKKKSSNRIPAGEWTKEKKQDKRVEDGKV